MLGKNNRKFHKNDPFPYFQTVSFHDVRKNLPYHPLPRYHTETKKKKHLLLGKWAIKTDVKKLFSCSIEEKTEK